MNNPETLNENDVDNTMLAIDKNFNGTATKSYLFEILKFMAQRQIPLKEGQGANIQNTST